jgi:hypothetical protein
MHGDQDAIAQGDFAARDVLDLQASTAPATMRKRPTKRGMLSMAISRSKTRDAHRDDTGLRLMAGRR